MRRAACGALLALWLGGCQDTGQLVLYVDTDAPVPSDPRVVADPERAPPLFDTLRFDLLSAEGAPLGVTRDFAVHEGLFRDQRASIGLERPKRGPLLVRVRMFRSDRLTGGQPPPSITLDSIYRVPEIDPNARVEITARLRVDDVGQPRGTDAPLEAEPGPPGASTVGSWPGATRVPCTAMKPVGSVCVPGGAFLMGDPSLAFQDLPSKDAAIEHVVVLSPYYLSMREIAVREFRSAVADGLEVFSQPHTYDPSQDPDKVDSWCRFTPDFGPFEDVPLNCLVWETAARYCHFWQGDLPTEAQLEFAASGRGAEHLYPWGNDDPACGDAIWGLGGFGGSKAVFSDGSSTCRPSASFGGPLSSGSSAKDAVAVPGGMIEDLGGNLSEWALDRFSERSGPYWGAPGIRVDPVADVKSASDLHPIHGGNWAQGPIYLHAGFRTGLPNGTGSSAIGFRCAWPGR